MKAALFDSDGQIIIAPLPKSRTIQLTIVDRCRARRTTLIGVAPEGRSPSDRPTMPEALPPRWPIQTERK